MKGPLLFLILSIAYSSANSGTLQDRASSFILGKIESRSLNLKSNDESKWNLDLYGFDFNMPHQPAKEQFIPSGTGIGATYKFNKYNQLWGKYSRFKVNGAKISNVKTKWDHIHYMAGFGFRFRVGDRERISFNLGLSKSSVEETEKFGKIEDLQTGVVFDTKYVWNSGMVSYGINLSLVQVGSNSEQLETHIKGGYASVGAVFQFKIPNL